MGIRAVVKAVFPCHVKAYVRAAKFSVNLSASAENVSCQCLRSAVNALYTEIRSDNFSAGIAQRCDNVTANVTACTSNQHF